MRNIRRFGHNYIIFLQPANNQTMPATGAKPPHSHDINGNDLEIKIISGRQLLPHMESIARLRISVFRAFPYLYEGDME